MKFLVAPDKFKSCLTAAEAADCIAIGIRSAIADAIIDLCPIADGGEGTVAAMLSMHGGRLIQRRVTGPLPEMKVDASYAMLADGITAVIEMAAASGLALLPIADRNPLNTTTFGTGELIVAAVREGAEKIILGLGGSATIDAGIGLVQACGFTILMRDGEPTSMTEPLCGRDLPQILMVKHGRGEVTSGIEIIGAADVTNPLLGTNGAAHIFGLQKGATPAIVDQLEISLRDLSERTGHQDEAAQPGAGAAGGLGFGVIAFLRGKIQSGFDLLAPHLLDHLTDADLCITGEGQLDDQSLNGKAVVSLARMCRSKDIPCIALVGSATVTEPQTLSDQGLTAYFSVCDGPMSLSEAMGNVRALLTTSARNTACLFASAT